MKRPGRPVQADLDWYRARELDVRLPANVRRLPEPGRDIEEPQVGRERSAGMEL